jgi:release factor glutamine methyltransferase
MRILELINKTAPFFEKHGVESPRLTIELLLAHALKKRRLDLYLEFERELDEATLTKLREMVRRRAEGEPLQYITGEAEFCGLKFLVDRRVLIPRPETELLVETVLAQVANRQPPMTIVDLCTGSGCIAVALAKKLGEAAEIYATDVSAEALAVAEENARRHNVEKKVRFFCGDLLSKLPDSLKVDAIVSNPPYIASGDLARLPKEVREFEPKHALIAGEDGLSFYRRIAERAPDFLLPDGFLCLELGDGQRPDVERLCVERGFAAVSVVKDLQGKERVLIARQK